LKPQAILPNLFEVKNDNLPMCDYSPPQIRYNQKNY